MTLELLDAVVGYEIALWNHLDAHLARAGEVSLAVFSALRVVDSHGGSARVRELQDDLRITVGSASKLADRLERDGFVVRRPNPTDRRSSLVELTPAGRDSYRSAEGEVLGALAEHVRTARTSVPDVVAGLRHLDDALTAAAVR